MEGGGVAGRDLSTGPVSQSLNHSLTDSFTYLLNHSFIYSLTYILSQSVNQSLTHILSQSVTHSVTHLHTQSISHSLTYSVNQSLSHSLTYIISQSVTQSLTYILSQSVNQSLTHILSQSVTHLHTQSISQSVTHLHTQSISHSVSHSLTYSVSQSVSHSFAYLMKVPRTVRPQKEHTWVAPRVCRKGYASGQGREPWWVNMCVRCRSRCHWDVLQETARRRQRGVFVDTPVLLGHRTCPRDMTAEPPSCNNTPVHKGSGWTGLHSCLLWNNTPRTPTMALQIP